MIYLDNAATSFPKPETVYRAVDTLSREGAGNPGRGGHRFAARSEEQILEARRAVARLLGARDPARVIFTLNATDALNMAIKGVLRNGDHAVTTDLEHNSISRPLEGLVRQGLITLTRVRSGEAGRIEPADIEAAMTPRTRLVAVCHVSNVLGVLQDAAALAAAAHRGGAILVLDASQSAGVVPIDVDLMGIDLCAFTGHKALLGPMGTGGLAVREGVEVRAWREGGTGGDSSSPTQPEVFPHYLEGGTPNAVGLAGLAAGTRYVLDRGLDAIRAHEVEMAVRLARAIGAAPRVRIEAAPSPRVPAGSSVPEARQSSRKGRAGPGGVIGAAEAEDGAEARGQGAREDAGRGGQWGREERREADMQEPPGPGAAAGERAGAGRVEAAMGLVTFTVAGYEPHEVAAILDQDFGIAVRAGLHCAPYIHRRRGLFPAGTVRASAGPFTTEQDIDAAAKAILEIASA